MKANRIKDQIFILLIVIIAIIAISLGFILPRTLLPIYEKNIYYYLKQPLSFVENDINSSVSLDTEIAYLYVDEDAIVASENFSQIIDSDDIPTLIDKIGNTSYGKFSYKKKVYYYAASKSLKNLKIAITDNSYIMSMRQNILEAILLVVGLTYIVVAILLFLWSNNLLKKINKLKEKVENINNDNYDHSVSFKEDDELYVLDNAIWSMSLYLKEQEEYKNQMYQNISHDFKTPITVMKSYIEACEDGIESTDKSLEIIKDQLNKLELKVHSLLYLNKINYIKDKKDYLNVMCDITPILSVAVDKFKMSRPDVVFNVINSRSKASFRGSVDMWETVIDNIIGNFVRYANKEITITVKPGKITLFNDGPNIDKNVMNNIFTPYEKGVKGVFGLGLSIVEKTLHMLNYDVIIKNKKNGVIFIIADKKSIWISYRFFVMVD